MLSQSALTPRSAQRCVPFVEWACALLTALHRECVHIAQKAKEDWGLEGLPVAYGLDPEVAKTQLGLYLTEHIGASKIEGMDWFEPTVFAESGFFVINSDGKVQVVEVSNSPFGRPDVDILKGGLAFAKKAGYPPRGTA